VIAEPWLSGISLAPLASVCDDRFMRWACACSVVAVSLALAGPALGQNSVEMETAPPQLPHFEIVPPSPATRDATKPLEADFYREDVRIRHEPAFIEPFVGKTAGGNQYGLSGWTAPNIPVGSLASRGYQDDTGAFALGITFLFDYPPQSAPRPAPVPR
jgi:hypothetical protein